MTARAQQTAGRPEVEGLERREAPSGSGPVAVVCEHLAASAAGGRPVVASVMSLTVTDQKVREA